MGVGGTRRWQRDLRDMAQVAWPIVLINLGQQAMGVVDAMMVGPLGGAALAAVALGNFYYFNVTIFGIGLIFALDPVVSQAVGAGDHEAVARGVQRGLVLSTVMTVLSALALMPSAALFGVLKQPTEILEATGIYVDRRLWGLLPGFVFVVLRQSLQALGPVRPVLIAVVIGNLVNVFANWLLIGGNWGAPALGVEGSGYATSVATWAMALVLAWLAWPMLRTSLWPWRAESLDRAPLLRLVAIGAPTAVQFFFETFAFGVTALLMGWMGTAALAAHEIALNLAAMTFMVPLGISGAAAAVVGRAIGRGDMPSARRDAVAAIVCGVGFMCLTALVFIGAPSWLATRFTRDTATLAIAVTLIPLAGWFQVFDGLQAVTSGVLRGTGDTRIPAILHMIAFWGVGVPLGYVLGFHTAWKERGLWMGLVAGLMAASLLQSARVLVRLKADIQRVRID